VDLKPLPQMPSDILGPATYVSNSLYLLIVVYAELSPLFPSGFRLQKFLKIHIFMYNGAYSEQGGLELKC